MILIAIQYILGIVRTTSTRYIVKTQFTGGEFPLSQWFNLNFLTSLTIWQVLGLILIASFTLFTFPLGIWIGSFKLGLSEPIYAIITLSINLFVYPMNLLVINKAIGEMMFTNQTYLGLFIVEASQLIMALGFWFIYQGNQGLVT